MMRADQTGDDSGEEQGREVLRLRAEGADRQQGRRNGRHDQ